MNNTTENDFPGKGDPFKPVSIDRRKQLGTEKKLWRIEVLFYEDGNNEKRYHFSNLTAAEVREFRQSVFSIGFMYCVSPGEWRVIPPAELKQINIFKQDKFFDI